MLIEKRKRQAPSKTPLYIAQTSVGFALFYALIAATEIEVLFAFYATIAGIMMTFFWCIVALCMLAFVTAKYYTQHSQPIKARAAWLYLLAIGIMSAGAASVALGGF